MDKQLGGFLYHSAKGSTWEKRGHRYVKRVWDNGKWKYFYKDGGKDQFGEYRRAFPEKNHTEKLTYGQTNKPLSGGSTMTTQYLSGPLSGYTTTHHYINEGSIERGMKTASKTVSDLANKGKSFVDSLFKKK